MAVHLCQLVFDSHGAVQGVHVAAAKAGELAPAETGVGGQENQGLPAWTGGFGQRSDLLGGGGSHLGEVLGGGALHPTGRPHDQASIDGGLHDGSDDLVCLGDTVGPEARVGVPVGDPHLEVERGDLADRAVGERGQDVLDQEPVVEGARRRPEVGLRGQPAVSDLFEPDIAHGRVHPDASEHVGFEHRQPAPGLGLRGEGAGRRRVAAGRGLTESHLPAPGWQLADGAEAAAAHFHASGRQPCRRASCSTTSPTARAIDTDSSTAHARKRAHVSSSGRKRRAEREARRPRSPVI